MGEFVQALAQGLVFGSVYGVAALGFALVYNATSIFHIAYAGIANMGPLVAMTFAAAVTPLWLTVSIPLALVTCVVIGCVIYLFVYRPMTARGAKPITIFVAALGVNMVISALLLFIYGPERRGFEYEEFFTQRDLGIFKVSHLGLTTVLLGLVVCAIVVAAVRGTLWGRQVRAVSSDAHVAELAGIRTQLILVSLFAASSALAAVAGTLLGMLTSVSPSVNPTLALVASIAVLLAGKGSYAGAYVAGLALGIAQACASQYLPGQWATGAVYGLFILVALIRPKGLLAGRAV